MNELFALFDEIGLPYHRQGTLADDDYNPEFFTFWNVGTPQDSFYDNKLARYNDYVQIGYYTNDPSKIYSQLDVGGEFYTKAIAKGFIYAALPQDANADKETFFGRVCFIRINHNVKE
jgi:hypothetical protein